MTKTISCANFKGGTGKTTLCVNIAGYLAKKTRGNKILVVDFDPQGNATSALGIDGNSLEYSIYDCILNECEGYQGVPLTHTILETDIDNLHLVPSELNLSAITMIMSNIKNRVSILHQILQPVKKYYDYILIDTPSDSGLFMFNSLRAADEVIVPIDSSIFSLEALQKFKIYCEDVQEMTDHGIEKITVILNRYTKVKSSNKGNLKSPSEEIEMAVKQMSYPFFTVPDSLLVYRSQREGLPISHYSPNTKIGKFYEQIANSL